MLTLEDRLAIMDVLNLHGHLCDRGDLAGMSALLTEEVTYDLSALGLGVLEGRASVREAAVALGEANPLAHHVTNIVVDQAPDGTVRASSKGLAVMVNGSIGSVTYDDTFQPGQTGWRIAHRVIRPRRVPLQP